MIFQWRFKDLHSSEWSPWSDIIGARSGILAVAIDFREKPKLQPGWYWATHDANNKYITHADRAVEWYSEIDLERNHATLELMEPPKVVRD